MGVPGVSSLGRAPLEGEHLQVKVDGKVNFPELALVPNLPDISTLKGPMRKRSQAQRPILWHPFLGSSRGRLNPKWGIVPCTFIQLYFKYTYIFCFKGEFTKISPVMGNAALICGLFLVKCKKVDSSWARKVTTNSTKTSSDAGLTHCICVFSFVQSPVWQKPGMYKQHANANH